MVGELFDYMVGIVIVGLIFISAVAAVPTISYVNLLHVNQQQLKNSALNIFNAMLLGTGHPPDWGSVFPFNESNVEAFGLAQSKESSLYVLDTDKVQRLDQESPGYITYSRAQELLGLADYGYKLTIFRPFTVDTNLSMFNDETPKRVSFTVDVTRNEDNRPIPNAQIKCTIMATAERVKMEPIAVVSSQETYFTDLLGHLEASETVDVPDYYTLTDAVAVLKITVAGFSTMVTARADPAMQEYAKIYTFGDTITLKVRDEFLTQGGGERRVIDISSYNYDKLMQMFDGSESNPPDIKFTPGEGYETWSISLPGLRVTNPLLLLFTLRVKNPNRFVIIAGPLGLWGSSEILSFGGDPALASSLAELRRYVIISEMTYITELKLWKE